MLMISGTTERTATEAFSLRVKVYISQILGQPTVDALLLPPQGYMGTIRCIQLRTQTVDQYSAVRPMSKYLPIGGSQKIIAKLKAIPDGRSHHPGFRIMVDQSANLVATDSELGVPIIMLLSSLVDETILPKKVGCIM